ncbi:MAG: transcriptional repressor LexA [Clostridia bacterium]|jgi:repressor LexA|nr:transcriptional repressor LexA [Clostridia bacterium]MDD3232145.1 transcriptional repressor LexA [Clostridia bacterium]MDD3862930.1 transcriptional repressor LexA [Clostridia bacterium]MDD4409000.1 transcriptional repressor LexA [Clostridia bacterium]
MKKIDEKLNKLIEFIRDNFLNKGYAPNVREMCKHLGVKSTSTIVYYLKKLEERGLIKRDFNKNRAIEYLGHDAQMVKNQFNMVKLPLLGRVAGGEPLLAEENLIDIFSVSQNFFGTNQDLFMLEVVGDSMIEIGIDHGDTIVAKIQNYAENGEIVVARTHLGTTVKKFYKENNCFRLQPQNISHLPMYFDEVEILGKVIAFIKRF